MKKVFYSLVLCIMLFPSILVAAVEKSPLLIDMEYIIIRPSDDGSIALMHMTNYKNLLDQEFKGNGESKAVLDVYVPHGAKNLQVHDNSLQMEETNTGFITKKAIPAQQSVVVPFSYFLEKNTKGFSFQYGYPVQNLQLLVPEGSGSLDIKELDYSIVGLFEFEGQKYYGYNISGIEANKPFTVIYDPNKQPSPDEIQPQESTATNQENTDNDSLGEITHSAPVFHNPGHLRMWYQSPLRGFEPHVFMGVIAAIIFGGLGYYSYFKWKSRLEEYQRLSDKEEQEFLHLTAKRKAILDKIGQLEDGYSSGEISDEEYEKKLEAYKHHLLQVKLNLKKYTE